VNGGNALTIECSCCSIGKNNSDEDQVVDLLLDDINGTGCENRKSPTSRDENKICRIPLQSTYFCTVTASDPTRSKHARHRQRANTDLAFPATKEFTRGQTPVSGLRDSLTLLEIIGDGFRVEGVSP
jgi:hypothetical protein